MIKPTIGRRVWFWPGPHSPGTFHREGDRTRQPCDAGIAYVHSDTMINISYADHNGYMQAQTSVYLWDGESEVPFAGYCQWMPYQTGQAAKTEALEAKASA